MSGDDAHNNASDAAFEALFAAAEECVERIENKRKGSGPNAEIDPVDPDGAPGSEEAVENAAAKAQDDMREAAKPSPPRPPMARAPQPAAPSKPSADGAVTLSLIKARDELGHLLANEKKQAAQLTVENQRLTQRVEKLKAGRDSVRERGQKERDAAIDAARDKLLKEFLPVLDNLERALQVELGEIPDELSAKVGGLRTGVDGVVQMFKSSLEKFGVVGFNSVGEPFDPSRHEAIRRVDDSSVPNNQVVEEYHRGYMIGERLLRAALVVVASGGPKGGDAAS